MRPGTGCQRPFWVLGCRRGQLRRGRPGRLPHPAGGNWGIGRARCRKRRSSTDRANSFLKPAILTTRFTLRPTRRWCTFCLKDCRRISMDRRCFPPSIPRSRRRAHGARVRPTTQPGTWLRAGTAVSGRRCESPSGGPVAQDPTRCCLLVPFVGSLLVRSRLLSTRCAERIRLELPA